MERQPGQPEIKAAALSTRSNWVNYILKSFAKNPLSPDALTGEKLGRLLEENPTVPLRVIEANPREHAQDPLFSSFLRRAPDGTVFILDDYSKGSTERPVSPGDLMRNGIAPSHLTEGGDAQWDDVYAVPAD